MTLYLHDLLSPLHVAAFLDLTLPRRLSRWLQETSSFGTEVAKNKYHED